MECDASLFEWPGKEEGRKSHEGDTTLFGSSIGKCGRRFDMIPDDDQHMMAQQVMTYGASTAVKPGGW